MMPRVCVVTAGNLATCPRMLKAADALAEAGYRVRVVSGRAAAWAAAADRDVAERRRGRWRWRPVDPGGGGSAARRLWSGLRRRAARAAAGRLGVRRAPIALVARAAGRSHAELVRAALAEPADLYYGGTAGALAAVAEAARRAGAPFGLDLEDFHAAEADPAETSRLDEELADRVLGDVIPGARFLTASSDAIARGYAERYGRRPLTVHNTFALPADPPELAASPGPGLGLYWFGQTVGPGRGLEDAVRAAGLTGLPVALHLRGRPAPGYLEALARLGAADAPRVAIVRHEPADPDRMVELCRGHDVGLALEQGHVPNRAWCLTNKAFTYILAALPVAFTDTPGQRDLARDLGAGAITCAPGDIRALADGLARWATDRDQLGRARRAAWAAARRRWHWEHPEERGALLDAVAKAVACG